MNGVLIINKPAGMTSHDVVAAVRRELRVRKAGHTGTLDPLATGVLPVCLGEATKLMPFLAAADKEYRAVMLLGVETDTQDIEGKVTRQAPPAVAEEAIATVLDSFQGEHEQLPPRYAALKFQGRPLYEWARRGVEVATAARRVNIRQIRMECFAPPYVTFFVACTKGTYIRSICADIGQALGCGACLAGLRRLRSGPFRLEQALPLPEVARRAPAELIAPAEALPQIAVLAVDETLATKIRHGYQPEIASLRGRDIPFLNPGDMVKINRQLVALAEVLCATWDLPFHNPHEQALRLLRVFAAEKAASPALTTRGR